VAHGVEFRRGRRVADVGVAPRFAPAGVDWDEQPLCEGVARIAAGSYVQKTREQIRSSGYVLHTLEAALWSFALTNSFEDGALLAVNLGDDADTTGAVYGQLAGAFYGYDAIPRHWRDRIARAAEIERLAGRLFEAAASASGSRR
jgi:ADP-ribosyl-[dinitrogen reductase] hydrolase